MLILNLYKSKQFFESINLFRGFAIWLIVSEHVMFLLVRPEGVSNYFHSNWTFIHRYCDVFMGGGTSYFVFISGFLFYTVFYQRGFTQITRESFSKFLLGKFEKVFCPYLVVVAAFICFRLYQDPGQLSTQFLQFGGFWYWSFWYIPFIMVVFFLSPIYIKFIQAQEKYRVCVFVISLLLSLLVGRHDQNPVLSALFWNSMYMFGILIGMNYKSVVSVDFGWKMSLFLLAVVFATVLCAIPDANYMHKGAIWNIDFGYIHVQMLMKMLLCVVYLFIFEFLSRAENIFVVGLKVLAKYSFSIFFLHQFAVLFFEQNQLRWFYDKLNFWTVQIAIVAISALICLICISVAVPIKRLTGKYSRSIIGA